MVKSTDSSDDKKSRSNEKQNEPGMRVGQNYQAEVPDSLMMDTQVNDLVRPEPLLVWAPSGKVADTQIDEYLRIAKDKYGYNMEQALGMLYWHKYEIEKAAKDLKNFTPLPDEWSMEDKVVFDQSFNSYGKSFTRIRQQLPDKSIGSLVRYYYSWKKNRNKKSLMDKGEKRDLGILNDMFADDGEMENESSDSDYEPNEKKLKASKNPDKNTPTPVETKPSPMLSTNCVNCAGMTPQMSTTRRGKMCTPCYDYWRRTGGMRPKDKEAMTLYHGPQHKLKRKPPKGIQLNQDTLIEVAQSHGDSHVRALDVEYIHLKRQLTTDAQIVNQQKESMKAKIDNFRPAEMNLENNPRWTNEELLIAVQCVRKYGKDLQAMADVLGNKTVNQCRNFFLNYRHRFNLLDVLAEYEKENNIPRHESKLHEDDNTENNVDNNYHNANSFDSGLSAHPPALRRQVESGPLDVPKSSLAGPPPLVSNSVVITSTG